MPDHRTKPEGTDNAEEAEVTSASDAPQMRQPRQPAAGGPQAAGPGSDAPGGTPGSDRPGPTASEERGEELEETDGSGTPGPSGPGTPGGPGQGGAEVPVGPDEADQGSADLGGQEPDPDEEDPDERGPDEADLEDPDPDEEDPGRPTGRRPARRRPGRGGASSRPGDGGHDPAWRSAVRGSRFGQVAVVLVAAFAIAIAAWLAVRPQDTDQAQGESPVVTQVDVEGAQKAPVAGDRAPAFTGTDITSQEVSLDPQATGGRPVWLMFVATWCTGCRTEMPDVQEAVAAYGEDVEVVVVYVGEDASAVGSYSQRVGNTFTEIPDRTQSISAAYGIMGVPSHFFIDADGTVRQASVGMLTPDEMAQALRALTGS